MLVKLGDVWVDPVRVVFMEKAVGLVGELEVDVISIVTAYGSAGTAGSIDEFASIINTALQSQSFGGEDGQKTTA